MSTFEQSIGLFTQTHFTVIELDLPVVEGECTIGGAAGFGTPLSCDQPSNAIRTYKFTQTKAPLLPESGIFRIVQKISENPAKLNSGKGLSSRGDGSITITDITGKDPNPDAPAVNDEVINSSSFFAKMVSRNVMVNRDLRIKNYRVEVDGTIDLENGAETRHYITESVTPNKNGEWSIKFKDELSIVEIDESVWPLPLEGSLINDIDDSVTTFSVDANVDYQVGDTVRSGDELMKINSVSNIGTGSASITVNARGSNIVYTNTLSRTAADEHSAGDEIYVCEVSDDERIDDFLERVLLDVGMPASYIPKSDWTAEIDEWHPNTRINTLWIESIATDEVLEMVLTFFMIDMWFDPVDREVKISAISSWKESDGTISEGREINFESIRRNPKESLRATRALVLYDKRFLASNDSVENYKKASLFARTELESTDLYGKPKTKRLDNTFLLDKDSADLLVNRWVNRYSNPFELTWETPERFRAFKTGDVLDTQDLTTVNFAGQPETNTRCQITSVKPMYRPAGRHYAVTGISYEPTFAEGSEIIISGSYTDINLYTQFAGAPSQAVELTFIFDASIIGSSGASLAAIRAGAFPSGSKLIIIMVNGADLQAAGGRGGGGESIRWISTGSNTGFWIPTDGADQGGEGGTVFDAEGVDCDIYFSGATPSAAYPTADGYIRAPSGGDGGFDSNAVNNDRVGKGGDSGNGGDGRNGGEGGQAGFAEGSFDDLNGFGDTGTTGNDQGTTSGWGNNGANNNSSGGAKGKGIVDNGSTVTLFGEDAVRYINGGGDH